jgi:hypothetical protein
MDHDIVEAKIWEILEQDLNLEDGVMMTPLKASEIGNLADSIMRLVRNTVAEASR